MCLSGTAELGIQVLSSFSDLSILFRCPSSASNPYRPTDPGHNGAEGGGTRTSSAFAQARKAFSPTHSGKPRPQARERGPRPEVVRRKKSRRASALLPCRVAPGGDGAGRAPLALCPREAGPGPPALGGRRRRARRARAGARPRPGGRRRPARAPLCQPICAREGAPRPPGCSGAFCRQKVEDDVGRPVLAFLSLFLEAPW